MTMTKFRDEINIGPLCNPFPHLLNTPLIKQTLSGKPAETDPAF